jgi:hypothetical protein
MKKRSSDMNWFPFWIDKWIFGSLRIECSLEQRAIWVDLLALAAKDDGFIRANVDVPYPIRQLAGMLIIDEPLLEAAIDYFVGTKKLIRLKTGVLKVTTWEDYQLSDRHKRRVEKEMSENPATMAKKPDAIKEKNIKDKIKKEDTRKKRFSKKEIFEVYEKLGIKKHDSIEDFMDHVFDEMWKNWPTEGRVDKKTAREKFNSRFWEGKLEEIIIGANGYFEFLRYKKVEENFEQRAMYLKTFLEPSKERWKEYIGFKVKPKL